VDTEEMVAACPRFVVDWSRTTQTIVDARMRRRHIGFVESCHRMLDLRGSMGAENIEGSVAIGKQPRVSMHQRRVAASADVGMTA